MATFHANLVQSFKNFKNKYIGNTSIAGIGDGTLTGAVAQIKSDLTYKRVRFSGNVTATAGNVAYIGDNTTLLPTGYTCIGGICPDGSVPSHLVIGSITESGGYLLARGYAQLSLNNTAITFDFICVKSSLIS